MFVARRITGNPKGILDRADLVVADYIDDTVITLLDTGVVNFSPTTPSGDSLLKISLGGTGD